MQVYFIGEPGNSFFCGFSVHGALVIYAKLRKTGLAKRFGKNGIDGDKKSPRIVRRGRLKCFHNGIILIVICF